MFLVSDIDFVVCVCVVVCVFLFVCVEFCVLVICFMPLCVVCVSMCVMHGEQFFMLCVGCSCMLLYCLVCFVWEVCCPLVWLCVHVVMCCAFGVYVLCSKFLNVNVLVSGACLCVCVLSLVLCVRACVTAVLFFVFFFVFLFVRVL